MKAFTIYQPYGYAIIAGLKLKEAGPAGKQRFNKGGFQEQLIAEMAYGKILEKEYERGVEHLKQATELIYGAVLGTVEIVDCVPVEEIVHTLSERERLLGDYSPGRFAWVLRNPVAFSAPVPAKGKQGWWNWDGE